MSGAYLGALLSIGGSVVQGQVTSWTWGQTHSSGSSLGIQDLAVDTLNGWVYAVGSYDGTGGTSTSGPFGLPASAGGTDAFLVKMDLLGQVIWWARMGGTGDDAAHGVALGPSGRVYVAGTYRNTIALNGSVLSTTLSSSAIGGNDAFLAAYGSDGTAQWVRTCGGAGDDVGHSVGVNGQGVYLMGTFRGIAQFGNTTVVPIDLANDQLFVVRHPITGGDPSWVRYGSAASGLCKAGGMAVNDQGVFVIGAFDSDQFAWKGPSGNALGSVGTTNNADNTHISRLSHSGELTWVVALDGPDVHENAANGIALGCNQVYIAGRCHAGTLFPGGVIPPGTGAHDMLYLAGLKADTGIPLWIRTAASPVSHGAEIIDLHSGPGNDIYLCGSFIDTLTLDDGEQFAGQDGQDLFHARVIHDGTLQWLQHTGSPGDEVPNAIAYAGNGEVLTGGILSDQLTLPPLMVPVIPGADMFLASLHDHTHTYHPNDPSRWRSPGALCTTGQPLDLDTLLHGSAVIMLQGNGVIDPGNGLGALDGNVARFETPLAFQVYDLADTLPAGIRHRLTWRSVLAGVATQAEVAFSPDLINWAISPSVTRTSSGSLVATTVVAPVGHRYLRITLPLVNGIVGFEIDGVRTMHATRPGGTWSGSSITMDGWFDPNGLSGQVPLSYTHQGPTCSSTTTRNILVTPEPSGILEGTAVVCPGSNSGSLQALALNPYTLFEGWAASTDGTTWNPIANTGDTLHYENLTATTSFSVRSFTVGCGAVQSAPVTITVLDTVPPEITCPEDIIKMAGEDCEASLLYPSPTVNDACGSTVLELVTGIPSGENFPMGPTVITYRATDGGGNSSECSFQVTIIDALAPTVYCPLYDTLPLYLGPDCHLSFPDLRDSVTVTDCSPWTNVMQPPAGTVFSGDTVFLMTMDITDEQGNHIDNDHWVRIIDEVPPVLSCPPILHVQVNGCVAQIPEITSVLVSIQDCSGVGTLTQSIPDGTPFDAPLAIEVIAIDIAGNSSGCIIELVPVDDLAPVLSCPAEQTITLPYGTNGAWYHPTVHVSDNCDEITLTPELPDSVWLGPGIHSYTIQATDGWANTSNCTFTVNILQQDCHGTVNGLAVVDSCGTCVGGGTGLLPCTQDCSGDWGGTAHLDDCGVCVGGTTGLVACSPDCAGVPGGNALPGTPCDDGDTATINDVWGPGCTCAGTVQACDGTAGTDQVVCGTTTTMQATGEGQWSSPSGISINDATDAFTQVISPQSGLFDLIWTTGNGLCSDTVHLQFITLPDASFSYAQSIYCSGSMPPQPWTAQTGGIFSSGSGLVLDPTTGEIDPSASTPGTYTITHSLVGPCPSSMSIEITIMPSPNADWEIPGYLCSNSEPIDLSTLVTGDPGGLWSGPGVDNGVLHPAGVQGSVTITYSVGTEPCTNTRSGTFTVHPEPMADAGPDGSTCTNAYELHAQASAGVGTWNLPPGATIEPDIHSPNGIVSFNTTGSHVLIWNVVDAYCSATDLLTIDVLAAGDPMTVDAGPDRHLSLTTTTHLQGNASATGSIQWTIAEGAGMIIAPTNLSTEVEGLGHGRNVFVLTVTSDACRSASDTVQIIVEDLLIPEGFSPNGDAVNDRFEITGLAAWPQSELHVFNRWGQEVYSDDGYMNAWDGRSSNGRELPDDTYFYVLNLGGKHAYNGYVIIKR